MTTLEEIEGEAKQALRCAGQDGSEPPRIFEVAQRLLGMPVEVVPFRALPGDGQLALIHGEPRIYVRRGLSPQRLRWVVAHELGHLTLALDSSTSENEDACDAFAAALLLPRRGFQVALREVGISYSKLGRWFGATESCTALRLGEVTGQPLALVAPQRVRVRGEEFVWPDEPTLRALAKKPRVPGVRKARLRDDRRRVAMRVG